MKTDRTIKPINEESACEPEALVDLPQKQNPDFEYVAMSDAKRKVAFQKSRSAWCSANTYEDAVERVHDTFWTNVLSRKAQRGNGEEIKKLWEYCFKACDSSRKNDVWDLKFGACLELLHKTPFNIGGDAATNNTAQLVPRGSKFASLVCPNISVAELVAKSGGARRRRDTNKLPGTGDTTCLTTTEMYQAMVFNFDRQFNPVKDQPSTEPLFLETRNPSPIFAHLQSLYAMHVTGEVTVWATHKEFAKLTGPYSPLKELLLYNKEVTLVRIMVEKPSLGSFFSKILPQFLIDIITKPKPCEYYIDRIEKALYSWRSVACPKISRATLLPDNKGEITPYILHIISPAYNDWDKTKGSKAGTSGGDQGDGDGDGDDEDEERNSGFLATCEI
jgi:hypothetical protein